MEFDATPWSLDVLDLLFDDNSGLLKDDANNGMNRNGIIQQTLAEQNNTMLNINFGDLDLFNGNLFENFNHSAEIDSLEYEPPDKKKAFHTDHDYIAHKSPSEHSDSGISVVSEDSSSVLRLSIDSDKNKTDDQLEFGTPPGYSPTCPELTNSSGHCSYPDSKTYNMLSENDTSITMAADTIYSDKMTENYDESCYTGNDDDISIDFDFDALESSLLSSDHHSRGTQSVLVLGGANKRVFPIQQSSKKDMTLPFTVKDVEDNSSSCVNFPELHLSDEEKELLAREGVSLPTNLPLTRDEERVLKAVRRKIRNKVSAKESRKRKQGYVEGLEQRIKHCTQENCDLHKKVDTLEKLNVTLMAQLKRLHSLVGKSKIHAQASTCAMVLLLSFALFIVPAFNPFGSTNENHTPLAAANTAMRGKARSLLEHEGAGVNDGDDDPYGVTLRRSPPWEKQSMTQASILKFDEKSGQDALSLIKPESTSTDPVSMKTQDNAGLGLLSRDIKIDIASGSKDYTVNANRSYTGNLITDQNLRERKSETSVAAV